MNYARRQFLESYLDTKQRLRLAVRMRGLYRAVMGNPTGFYTLDLGSTQGRLAAVKVCILAWARLRAGVRGGKIDEHTITAVRNGCQSDVTKEQKQT